MPGAQKPMPTPLRGRERKGASAENAVADFELLFRCSPALVLALEADAGFTIVDASDAYLAAARVAREAIVGRPFFEVFPESAAGPEHTGAASSRAALERVLATRMGDGFNIPVPDSDGGVRYVLHRFDAMEPDVLRRARERDDAMRDLERANEELDAFVHSTSQGLQTSLRAIESFCRLFEKMRGGSLDEGTRRLLMRVTSQVNRMDTIIEGLLGLSRSGRNHMSRRRVDVSAVVQRVVDQVKLRSPGRVVVVQIEEGMEAWADEGLLAMALENLVSNAWKFTRLRADARIDVGSGTVAGQAVFHVRDNGVGFDMAHAEKLFAPFVKLHQASDFDGHGIGLATVKRIVERHGGEIWAEARPGEGATFHFTLSGAPDLTPRQPPVALD
jgi:signal transduction histidine kinase